MNERNQREIDTGSETPTRARSERGEVENGDQQILDDTDMRDEDQTKEHSRSRTGAGE